MKIKCIFNKIYDDRQCDEQSRGRKRFKKIKLQSSDGSCKVTTAVVAAVAGGGKDKLPKEKLTKKELFITKVLGMLLNFNEKVNLYPCTIFFFFFFVLFVKV